MEILQRLGVTASLGFDCLPRFIARHQAIVEPGKFFQNALILSGAVNMAEPAARQIARVVGRCRKPGQRLAYLTGAKCQPAFEDQALYGWMRDEIPSLELYSATSMEDWLGAIKGASGLR